MSPTGPLQVDLRLDLKSFDAFLSHTLRRLARALQIPAEVLVSPSIWPSDASTRALEEWESTFIELRFFGVDVRLFYRGLDYPQRPYGFRAWGNAYFGIGPVGGIAWGMGPEGPPRKGHT